MHNMYMHWLRCGQKNGVTGKAKVTKVKARKRRECTQQRVLFHPLVHAGVVASFNATDPRSLIALQQHRVSRARHFVNITRSCAESQRARASIRITRAPKIACAHLHVVMGASRTNSILIAVTRSGWSRH